MRQRQRTPPPPLRGRSPGRRPVGRGGSPRRRGLVSAAPPLPAPPPQGGGREQTEPAAKKVAKIHDKSGPERILFSEKFACPVSGFTIPEIEPPLFSFNNPYGACPACGGLGVEQHIDEELVIPDKELSLRKGAIAPWAKSSSPLDRKSTRLNS